ncbi:glutathione S-transferase 1-like [Ischnura elegans]|uniref:glutathione S-transferase 1-like n=1 Tax=Ischnura elegans TaxID=197161 RepID=UPI001ED877E6|nr:glutathione S-transferase 1-like [Ischnura elegans]
MPLDLYCVDVSPPVRAVLLTGKALGIEFNLKLVDLFKGDHLSPEFTKINPRHTIPTLVDDGFILWDSHAIIAYLVNKYGKDDSLYPKDPQARAVVDQMLHFDTGTLFPRLRNIGFPLLFLGKKDLDPKSKKDVEEAYGFMESFLEGQDWVAGKTMTIADFCCVATITSLELSVIPMVQDFRGKSPEIPCLMRKMTLDLYYLNDSAPVRAVLLAGRALGLEFNMKLVDILKQEHMSPEFLKLNPQHSVPTLVDEDFTIWDSHAIVGYLATKYGTDDSLYPKEARARATVDQRLHFDSGILHPRLRNIIHPLLFLGKPAIGAEVRRDVEEAYHFLEKFLDCNEWVAGENMTIADFCCVSTVSSLDVLIPIGPKYPNLSAWYKRCKEKMVGYEEANQAGLNIFERVVKSALSQK